jgi:hypothetical protein
MVVFSTESIMMDLPKVFWLLCGRSNARAIPANSAGRAPQPHRQEN